MRERKTQEENEEEEKILEILSLIFTNIEIEKFDKILY